MHDVMFILAGFQVGLVVGLTGVGGKLLAGSLPGIWLCSHLMQHTPERLVRSLLPVRIAFAGVKLATR